MNGRVHAITRTITPRIPVPSPPSSNSTTTYAFPNPGIPATGLEYLETEKFRLTCFQTLTGTKFLLFTDPLTTNIDVVIRKIYELYADYVMKNPFYQLEMPVRCEAFDRHLGGWLRGRTWTFCIGRSDNVVMIDMVILIFLTVNNGMVWQLSQV